MIRACSALEVLHHTHDDVAQQGGLAAFHIRERHEMRLGTEIQDQWLQFGFPQPDDDPCRAEFDATLAYGGEHIPARDLQGQHAHLGGAATAE